MVRACAVCPVSQPKLPSSDLRPGTQVLSWVSQSAEVHPENIPPLEKILLKIIADKEILNVTIMTMINAS